MDDLEARIADLQASRRSWPPSDLTWTATRSWTQLGLRPGPVVGEALTFLLELRLEEGPLGDEEATAACGSGRPQP